MPKSKAKYKNLIYTIGDDAELIKIRDFVQDKAIGFGFDEMEAQKIALAVDEACTNLIKHAYKLDPTKNIYVEIDTASNKFTVNIYDEGSPFNPMDAPTPDMKEYFSKYKHGGLGIHIMRLVMDEIAYFPAKTGNTKNLLKLTKILH